MNPGLTVATAGRVLRQVRTDHRTIALIIVVPCVLLGLLAWIYNGTPVFDRIGPALLGVFPMVVMFIVTSVATLRERQSGTLERLLTTPMGKGDFMLGYAVAFGLLAIVQAVVATGFAVWVCDLDIAGPLWLLVVVAVVDAVLGTALGLLASGFARTEFQAVQFMPAFILPQFLLCGLLVPREQLPPVLEWVSNLLPLSYAVDAMKEITRNADPFAEVATRPRHRHGLHRRGPRPRLTDPEPPVPVTRCGRPGAAPAAPRLHCCCTAGPPRRATRVRPCDWASSTSGPTRSTSSSSTPTAAGTRCRRSRTRPSFGSPRASTTTVGSTRRRPTGSSASSASACGWPRTRGCRTSSPSRPPRCARRRTATTSSPGCATRRASTSWC